MRMPCSSSSSFFDKKQPEILLLSPVLLTQPAVSLCCRDLPVRMCSGRPLQEIAKAFSDLIEVSGLRNKIDEEDQEIQADVQVVLFADACSRVSVLFRHLGFAFKFAEQDYVSKVRDLAGVSKEMTLQSIIELDIRDDCVKVGGSHSRNLLRVKRGLDMVRVLFKGLMDSVSLKESASHAYTEVFSAHHSYPIRAAVAAGMYTLPTRSNLLGKLNEDESSAIILMEDYVTSVGKLVEYIDGLFISRGLGIDW